jgi:hypothetical protein
MFSISRVRTFSFSTDERLTPPSVIAICDVLASEGLQSLKLPPRSPNWNAFASAG